MTTKIIRSSPNMTRQRNQSVCEATTLFAVWNQHQNHHRNCIPAYLYFKMQRRQKELRPKDYFPKMSPIGWHMSPRRQIGPRNNWCGVLAALRWCKGSARHNPSSIALHHFSRTTQTIYRSSQDTFQMLFRHRFLHPLFNIK